jgi:hypothetical protein
MNDAGYTLTETLAAMSVIALSIGGLSLAMQPISGLELATGATVKRVQTARAAQAWIERRLGAHAPYRAHEPARLAGDASGFHFDCGAGAPCAVSLVSDDQGLRIRASEGSGQPVEFPLPTGDPARFVYRGAGEPTPVWPPADTGRQALRAVSLLQGDGETGLTLFTARIWVEQPAACGFDPVMQDCR